MNFQFHSQHNSMKIYKSKENPNLFRGIFSVCKATPMQVFEEILMPSNNSHWHPLIKNYEIFPSDFDKSSIVRESVEFESNKP